MLNPSLRRNVQKYNKISTICTEIPFMAKAQTSNAFRRSSIHVYFYHLILLLKSVAIGWIFNNKLDRGLITLFNTDEQKITPENIFPTRLRAGDYNLEAADALLYPPRLALIWTLPQREIEHLGVRWNVGGRGVGGLFPPLTHFARFWWLSLRGWLQCRLQETDMMLIICVTRRLVCSVI